MTESVEMRPNLRWGLVCLTAYVFLLAAYLIPGDVPWDKSITWNDPFRHPASVLLALELVTLTLVSLLFVVSNRLPRSPVGAPVVYIETVVYAVAAALVVAHAGLSIRTGEDPVARVPYAVFSLLMLLVWLRAMRLILATLLTRYYRCVHEVQHDPLAVYSEGRDVGRYATIIVLAVLLYSLPAFTWIPTLVPTGLSPGLIACTVGATLILTAIAFPVYSQVLLTHALSASLRRLDRQLAETIVARDVRKDASELKALVELRDALAKSVQLPLSSLALVVLQLLAAAAALVAIWKEFK